METKEELLQLSNLTFFTNGAGAISAADVRGYNAQLIDAIPNARNFTYVVDTNEKLVAWRDAADGNDYSSVLIRKIPGLTLNGSQGGIDGQITGTKYVEGEPGATITMSGDVWGCFMNIGAAPNKFDTGIRNVHIIITETDDADTCTVFSDCYNVVDCSVELTTSIDCVGFSNCTNMERCYIYITATGNSEYTCFYGCSNVSSCAGSVQVETGMATASVYSNCTLLDRCFGQIDRQNTAADEQACYRACVNLTSCVCDLVGEFDDSDAGFIGCKIMFGCYPKTYEANPLRSLYQSCFMTRDNVSGTAVADTAAGGYNRVKP